MRILISTPRFEPGKTLGSEIYLQGFLESLGKILEKDVVAVVGSEKTCEWGEDFAGNLTWMPEKLPESSVRRMIFERGNIERIARKWNADVIYFPFNIMPRVKIPGVLLLHDLVNEFYCKKFPFYRPIYYRYIRHLVRRSIKNADAVITISNAVADELKTLNLLNDVERIYVAPLAVNRIRSKQKRPNLLPPNGKKIILQSGAQLPHKSHMTGIKAMAEIKKKHPQILQQIQLVLTGGTNNNKNINDFIRKNEIQDNIIFLGRLDEDELEWVMQNARVSCFPTLYEGFGLGVVDAQIRQTLIIASDIPVLKEVSGGAAIIFEPENEKDLAQKIVESLRNNDNNSLELIKKGFENVNKWTWKAHSQKVLEVLKVTANV